ncbi:MAG: SdrD B-like domain-containing protein, partial [Bacteroidota bacterium]
AGNDPHLYANLKAENEIVWDDIGKLGLADIELSADGQTLWAVNLFDRRLYEISVQGGNVVQVHDFIRPLDCPAHPNTPVGELDYNIRPGGLAVENGVLYYTLTCTAENIGAAPGVPTDYLAAYVYSYENGVHQQVARTSLDYARLPVTSGRTSLGTWNPWITNETFLCNNGDDLAFYPQPWAFDIGFDEEGYLVLGLADRFGDQTGANYLSGNNTCTNGSFDGVASGDVLVFAKDNNGNYVVESNGVVGNRTSATGVGTGQGLNGGEFLAGEQYSPTQTSPNVNHPEIALGPLAIQKGRDEVILAVYDPGFRLAGDNVNAGGLIWLDLQDGSRTRSYELYENGDAGTFAKAAGIGDIELMCALPPLEIGNYVWCDYNVNGLQDAGEDGIDGITVQLYDRNDMLVGVTSTANGGQYYFNGTNVDTTGVSSSGATPNSGAFTGMSHNTTYTIVFGDGQFSGGMFTTSMGDFGITPVADANANADDNIDSDVAPGSLNANNLPFLTITTDLIGCAVHTYDLGLNCNCEFEVELGGDQELCATAAIDLTTYANAFTPSLSTITAADGTPFRATWTTSGTGTFNGMDLDSDPMTGDYATATTYTPSAADQAAGQVMLTLTTDDLRQPPFNYGKLCEPDSDDVMYLLLRVDCGTFPWGGN